ncbi:MAG: hypothetical protein WBZ20_06275 [Nitrososphaeraceae archaeon]
MSARYHLPPLPLHTFTGLAKNMNSGGEERRRKHKPVQHLSSKNLYITKV